MEKMEKETELTTNGGVHEEMVACSRCGCLVKYPRDCVRGENGTIICKSCYREILFPHLNDHSMELFD
jgi:formylmethanofuran dehydrogenase subunit E